MFVSGIQQKLGSVQSNVVIGTLNVEKDDNHFGDKTLIELIEDDEIRNLTSKFIIGIEDLRNNLNTKLLSGLEEESYKRILLNFGNQDFNKNSSEKQVYISSPTTWI